MKALFKTSPFLFFFWGGVVSLMLRLKFTEEPGIKPSIQSLHLHLHSVSLKGLKFWLPWEVVDLIKSGFLLLKRKYSAVDFVSSSAYFLPLFLS
jgi:hypothetical protein